MTLPTLNMTGWRMVDFEMAYEALTAMDYAALAMTNQPRAADYAAPGRLRPGAEFISSIAEDWLHFRLQELSDRLEQIRFQDPVEDDRRVCLIIRRNAALYAPVVDLLAMAERERMKPAA